MEHYIFIFIFYLTLIHSITPQEQIKPLVYGSNDGSFNILLEMGEPSQMVYLCLDMAQTASWLTHNVYRPEYSYSGTNIGETSTMELRYFAYDSQIKKEILHVKQKNFKLDNFYFHYLDIEKPEGTFDSLALPYTFKDTKMSLIHQLYKNGSLSKKQFSFVPIDQDVGYIYLGYLPKEVLDKNNFKQIASCKVDSHYNTWGCNIERVYIDTNVYESDQYAYFNTVSKYTFVPRSFMSFFSETFMREYLTKNICQYDPSSDTYQCNCEQLTQFPKVVIILGRQSIELSKEVLFTNINSQCKLTLKTNPMNMNWIFGTDFIEKHITTFNYDKGTIEIYSNRTQFGGYSDFNYYLTGKRTMSLIQTLIIFTGAMFLTFLLGYIYIKVKNVAHKKRNKKRKKKYYNQLSLI